MENPQLQYLQSLPQIILFLAAKLLKVNYVRLKASLSKSPASIQFIMLCLLVIFCGIITYLLGLALVPLIFPMSLTDLQNALSTDIVSLPRPVLEYLQELSSVGTFLIPALIAAHLFSDFTAGYLKINSFPRRAGLIIILLVVLMMSSTVIADGLYRVTESIKFPESLMGLKEAIDRSQGLVDKQISAFLDMNGFGAFLKTFFIMAVLPAICEETLFRGVLQPVFIKGFKNVHIGIWLSAFCFAFFHLEFYTFLSILALGAVLGYFKQWSGSLWVSVIMHLINNGMIIIAVYFFDVSLTEVNKGSDVWQVNMFWYGLIVFGACFLILYRLLKKTKPTYKGGL